jgi:antitoxin VapB
MYIEVRGETKMIKAKVFKNGNSQAIRLPKEFAFKTKEVCVKQIGSLVVLFQEERDPWKGFRDCLEGFSKDFMDFPRDQGRLEKRAKL